MCGTYIYCFVHTCGGGHLIDERASIPIQHIIVSLESRQPDPCFRIFIIIYICRFLFLFYSSVSLRYRTGIRFIYIYIIYYGYATNAGIMTHARCTRRKTFYHVQISYQTYTYNLYLLCIRRGKLVPVVCKSVHLYDT